MRHNAMLRQRLRIYRRGKSDQEIARLQGCHKTTIAQWRRRAGLAPNFEPTGRPCDAVERRRLYDQGLNDVEIARRQGVGRTTIVDWRYRNNLPTHVEGKRGNLTPQETARRLLLWQLGWSDKRIAADEGLGRTTVHMWRRPLGLAANVERKRKATPITDVLTRIKRAIGAYLPPDIADDAAGDLVLAILDGTLSVEEVEGAARKYGNRALDQYASKFGPRSLDEELGDEDGFRMIDMIRDERSSSWLEEMGATVW